MAEAAKQHPSQIVPFGYVDLDVPDVVQQVEEFHSLGYRGLGELEFVKKPFNDPSYFPVYELANRYTWIVLFHLPNKQLDCRKIPISLIDLGKGEAKAQS